MNARDFAKAIRIVACEGAAEDVVDELEKPSGRRPDPRMVELSVWFHRLPPDDRDCVARVIREAAEQATYNFLSVLDGLAAIAPQGKKPTLELFCVEEGSRQLLNDPNQEELTALFKEP